MRAPTLGGTTSRRARQHGSGSTPRRPYVVQTYFQQMFPVITLRVFGEAGRRGQGGREHERAPTTTTPFVRTAASPPTALPNIRSRGATPSCFATAARAVAPAASRRLVSSPMGNPPKMHSAMSRNGPGPPKGATTARTATSSASFERHLQTDGQAALGADGCVYLVGSAGRGEMSELRTERRHPPRQRRVLAL